MALTTKRIIALPSQTDPQEGDYLAIDNLQGGTHKIPVGRVGVEVDDTLTEAGKAADAKAVGDAIDEIRSQIEVTGTASGAIATFTDGADMPAKSVIVNIEPQQSGTGTPSPSNIRPISGWESVSVFDINKNLLPITMKTRTVNGITFTVEKDASGNVLSIAFSGTTTSTVTEVGLGITPPLKGGAYIINGCSNPNNTIRLQLKKKGEAAAIAQQFNNNDVSFTAIDGTEYVVTICIVGNGMAVNATIYPMIRLASDTDATFELYNGHTTTTSLGRTVCGGTLDVVSGVLTVTHAYLNYNGSENWQADSSRYTIGVSGSYRDGYTRIPVTSNEGAFTAGSSVGTIFLSNTRLYYYPPTSVTSLADFKTWLASNNLQVVYPLATPQTHQLTPTEVSTLLGENNVWADSGDVEVVYVRDLNIAINNLLNSNGTRSLGMMAMSAPAKDTAEEPTDEQTEEPAEDDMR